ncbi:hypothetical protein PENTCL1PPCAC_14938, partial [Pristionchus entomophagus]
SILPTGTVSIICMLISCFVLLKLERILRDHKDRGQHRSVITVSSEMSSINCVPFQTLTYQMVLPMGSLIGISYWFLDMIYQLHAEWLGRLLMMTECFICLASPIINLSCLPPYRKSFTGWQKCQSISQTSE